jgi:vacuolar-type H+-ATPase subunit H
LEVKYLVGESIERIKKAEENAKNQINEAQSESDRMLRGTRERAEEIIEEAKKQAAEEAKLIIKKAEEEAAREVALLKEKNEVAKEEIRATAEGNKSKAASFIIGRVIG